MPRARDGVIELLFFAAVLLVFVARAPRLAHFLMNPDHCYQLAAGEEVLRGRVPGVDLLTNFGPLIPLLAAATLSINENLVPEVILCAAGWALAVWLVLHLMRRGFGWVAALCAGVLACLLIARFHRWYVWLMPLAAVAAVDAPGRTSQARWLLAGVLCGLGSLFRPELGAGTVGALAIVGLADALRERGLRWPHPWLPLLTGFLAPLLAWAATITIAAGFPAFVGVLRELRSNVSGSVEYWSKPPPPFVASDPFSPESAHALTLQLLLWVQVAMAVVGGWLAWVERTRTLAREGRLLAAIGLVGLSFYPHTVYRADIHHLWQGIWPLLMGVPALCVVALRFARAGHTHVGRVTWPARVFVAASALLAAVTAAALLPIARLPHYDLAPIQDPPFAGIDDLRRGLASVPDHPYARLIAVIQQVTQPDDKILSTYGPQFLLFAHRAPIGYRVTYERGIHDSPAWRRRELARLEESPPPVVVALVNFYQMGPDDGFRASQPEMYDFVRARYRAAGRFGSYILLGRNDLVHDAP